MSHLFVPVRWLPYGLYHVTFTVTMDLRNIDTQLEYSSSVDTAILIVPSPLNAQVVNSGMNFISAGFGNEVVLNPRLFSKDPDIEPSQNQVHERQF